MKPLHFEATCKDLDLKRDRVLAELHPVLEAKVRQICSMLGGRVTPYCGYRGPAEQRDAHELGFSKAVFGQSPHNFHPALACDLVLDPRRVDVAPHPENTAFPDLWDDHSPAALATWTDLDAAAKELGLDRVWLSTRKRDFPHVQLPGWQQLAKVSVP